MALYHINFHTLDNKPVFELDAYDGLVRQQMCEIIKARKILCPAWEVMPTHVHMIVEDFLDMPRGRIVNYVKGGTSHAFFEAFPDLRPDLLGGHLWTKGYYFVCITTHHQFLATLEYVRTNRTRADLPPPTPLEWAQ